MRLMLVADGRSPITRGWVHMAAGLGHHIILVSTFLCDPVEGAEIAAVLPVGFSAVSGAQVKTASRQTDWQRALINRFRPALMATRAYLAPMQIRRYQAELAKIVCQTSPDIVHALRIPFEGMLAAAVPRSIPVALSIWGNDLTFHARSSPLMARATRAALRRADGLHSDAARDIRLAVDWGLNHSVPTFLAPGNGGLDLTKMQQKIDKGNMTIELPEDRPVLVNPRGFRPGSVHQDVFFKTIPLVLEQVPNAFFVCTAMQGQPQAEKWVRDGHLQANVLLLPYLPQEQLWQLYRRSQVYISLSSHDGTPNTFLEALACGCFPVVGNIESLSEWIKDGENGLLVNPHDPQQASVAIIHSLENAELRSKAVKINWQIINQRANMALVRKEYQIFLDYLVSTSR